MKSRLRISLLEQAFVHAVGQILDSDPDLTHEEVLIALNHTTERHLKHLYLDEDAEVGRG